MTSRRRGVFAAVALIVVVLAAACGGGGGDDDGAESGSTSSSSTSSTTTTTVATGPVAPLTGLPIDEDAMERTALMVKIGNNDDKARPQTGLAEADLVYEEKVEGLKTRLAAVFQSVVPESVGPVRSARLSDLELVGDLGKPMVAYSGGNPTVLGAFRIAADEGRFVDVGEIRREGEYSRDNSRARPDNLYVDTTELDAGLGGAPTPLFSYGELPDAMGTPTGGVDIRYPASFGRQSTHIWDEELGGWVRLQDGTVHTAITDGEEVEIAPVNVVVPVIDYSVSRADPSQSPKAEPFGMGDVFVFTRGRVVEGSWERQRGVGGWILTDADGEIIPLEPGATWVLLAAAEGSAFGDAEITVLQPEQADQLLLDARAERAESAAS